jgi:hypothetical protein
MPTIPTKFFVNPFAVAGDKTSIPNDTQPNGSISYSQGWGPNYALDQNTNPSALDVDRAATNQFNYDVTTALQQYQTWGVPNFISISDNNNDGPYAYSKYAYCLYDDGVNGEQVFQSLISNNTNIPATSTTSQNFTVSGNNLIISSSTDFYTGAAVEVSTTGALPTPLAPNTIYYVINVSPTSIALASTLSNALNNIPINLGGSPSGTNTVTIPITWRLINFVTPIQGLQENLYNYGDLTGGTSTAYTLTLDPPLTQFAPGTPYPPGARFSFTAHTANGANATFSIDGIIAGNLIRDDSTPVAPGVIRTNVKYEVVSDGTDFIVPYVQYAEFSAAALTSSGYQPLPNRCLRQWGFVNVPSGSHVDVLYPIAFPSGAFQGFATPGITADSTNPISGGVDISILGPSMIRVYNRSTQTCGFSWEAIGK